MILAIDSSAGTAVAVADQEGTCVARAQTEDRRSHAEAIGPLISEALEQAGADPSDITAVVMGVGPGPFTGLRVGMAAAQSFAWVRSTPVWPVRSHDAAALNLTGEVAVVSDARRGEWAMTRYRPHPDGAVGVAVGPTRLLATAELDASETHVEGARIIWLESVDPAALAVAALALHARGEQLLPARPIYLREPDVTMPQ